ncbi:unnamed protein product [Paramecium primaurelia]|uniref:Rab-GAP TBC domain-containing protein n=1 Tax=Paramecium primaurelia TaxID=5886 RepID=A0A8S1K198_PARPR|nr:unnamed protein product [Paramecium primaurelia]
MGNICNSEQRDEQLSNSLKNTYFSENEDQPYAPIKPIIQNKIDRDNSLQIGVCFDKSEIINQEICIQLWEGLVGNPQRQHQREPGDLQKALYTIHKNEPERFAEVLEQAGGGQIRWFVWKTLLYSCIKYKHQAMKIRQTERLSIVERDVKRTFPSHPFFQLESQSSQLLSQLLNLVGATFKGIGYTQGMNFILAFMLMQSGGNIEQTWSASFLMFYCSKWMLYAIYMTEFPLMRLICSVTKEILKQQDVQLYKHYMKLDIDDSYLLCKWIFTLYLYNIPKQACLHFWDIIFQNGIFIIASINCQLLISIRTSILSFKNSTQFLEYAQELQQNQICQNYKEIKNNALKTIPQKKIILFCINSIKDQYEKNSSAQEYFQLLQDNFEKSDFEKKYQNWMENNLQQNSN